VKTENSFRPVPHVLRSRCGTCKYCYRQYLPSALRHHFGFPQCLRHRHTSDLFYRPCFEIVFVVRAVVVLFVRKVPHATADVADLSRSRVGRRRVGHRIRPMSCPRAGDNYGFRFGSEPEGVGKGQTAQYTAVGPGRPGRTSHSR